MSDAPAGDGQPAIEIVTLRAEWPAQTAITPENEKALSLSHS
jgi:hypothetical protein